MNRSRRSRQGEANRVIQPGGIVVESGLNTPAGGDRDTETAPSVKSRIQLIVIRSDREPWRQAASERIQNDEPGNIRVEKSVQFNCICKYKKQSGYNLHVRRSTSGWEIFWVVRYGQPSQLKSHVCWSKGVSEQKAQEVKWGGKTGEGNPIDYCQRRWNRGGQETEENKFILLPHCYLSGNHHLTRVKRFMPFWQLVAQYSWQGLPRQIWGPVRFQIRTYRHTLRWFTKPILL